MRGTSTVPSARRWGPASNTPSRPIWNGVFAVPIQAFTQLVDAEWG
jgi:hypothetical protein